MNRFANTIQEIDQRLDLPQPTKSRILLEIAADLEDLHRYYLESGLSNEEAHTRAVAQCEFSDESIAELVRIHTAPWRRFLDRLSVQGRSRWERILLLVLLVFIAVTSGRLMLSVDLFTVASAAVWPILGITGGALFIALEKFYLAYIKQEHNLIRLRAGLPVILLLAGCNLAVGAFGYWLALYRAARLAMIDVSGVTRLLTGWLISSSAMLVVSILCALAIALLWFILANKIARIEQAEATVLLMK